MEGCEAVFVRGIDIGTPSEEKVDAGWVAFVRSPHQRRVSLRILYVDWDELLEEKDEEEDIAVEGSQMQDVVPLNIGQEGVCSVMEEQVDDIVMTPLGCPHGRCSHRLSSSRIDIGARFEQELAESVLVVNRGPLEDIRPQRNTSSVHQYPVHIHAKP